MDDRPRGGRLYRLPSTKANNMFEKNTKLIIMILYIYMIYDIVYDIACFNLKSNKQKTISKSKCHWGRSALRMKMWLTLSIVYLTYVAVLDWLSGARLNYWMNKRV